MSNKELGLVLIFSPFILFILLFLITEYIDGWRKAVYRYKHFEDSFCLIAMTVTTIFITMLFSGLYLLIKP
jgi:hypothetical protein